jgi:hypothetical protein
MLFLLSPGSFFGQTLRTPDSMGFRFARAQFAPSPAVPEHAPESAPF